MICGITLSTDTIVETVELIRLDFKRSNTDEVRRKMRLTSLISFAKELKGKKPVDIDKIQNMGLLAVKLGQICALRPDLLEPDRCIQLQELYSRAPTIPRKFRKTAIQVYRRQF